jgi:hypothetical protein
MSPEIKLRMLKWIEALESGKYRQGKGALHSHDEYGDQFCCLGVACDIFKDELDLRIEPHATINIINGLTCYRYNQDAVYLPRAVGEYLQFHSEQQTVYASLNDQGKSFKELAGQLRETYQIPKE